MRYFLIIFLTFVLFFQTGFVWSFNASALRSLVRQYEGDKLQVGIHVYSLKQNKDLFAYKATEKMNPASNAKVLSSAAAFSRLGADFRFETKFMSLTPISGGEIHDLYIVGGGDPQITEEKVSQIVDELFRLGLRTISGDIVIDQSYFDKKGFGDSMGNSGTYRAPLNALVVNFNRFGVVVTPGKSKPTVAIDFPSDYFLIKSDLRNGKGSVSVTKKFDTNHEAVWVKGAFRGKKSQVIYRDVTYPSLFAGYFFKSFFEKRGIKVLGRARETVAPSGAQTIYIHQSDSLAEIVKVMNKRSINFTAEMITKYLGARFEGAPGSTAKGVKVVGDYLKSIGISPSSFTIENGSGLSRVTHITPMVLTQVFRDIKSHPTYSREYLETLAIAGEDGTVKKRFKDSILQGRAYLKTGTLNGVSSLAGYVSLPSSETIAFSILVNGSGLNAWKAHEFQESVLETIAH